MKRTGLSVVAAAWLLAAGMAVSAHADVRTITITARGPALNGQSFGTVGSYEQITGIATGEINPEDPRNALITDIDLAPLNARGMVEYRTTFTIRKPVDMSHAPGVLFYNIVNRGNPGGPANWHVGGDPGDGFLYNLGHALLWSGWQGDQPIASVGAGREGIDVPVAKNRDGSPVTGRVVERFINVAGAVNTQPVGGAGRMPLTRDTTKAVLISVASETPSGVKGGVKTIPSNEWAFADCRTVPFPGTPDPVRLCLKSGFDPALLYELTYTAKDPYVLGVGMAAMRDVVSFFRYAEKDSAGAANPLFGLVPHVIGMGNSQSGRFAKAFLNLGFNEDEHGRIVWDGLNVRIAGMLGGFNTRFAQPGDIAELYMPGAEGPLWWGDHEDKVRGLQKWGLLHRCSASRTCPKVTETFGGPEVWYSRGTIGIAGTTGNEDLALPEDVRRYYHAGTSHGGGMGGFNLGTRSNDPNVLAGNPNPQREIDRALYVALVDWVAKGTLPPASAYPRVSDGTLVPATSAAMGWPSIPHAPKPDGVVNSLLDYDFGSRYRYNDSSGVITNVPPSVKRVIPTLVPKVDADGNDVAGVKSLLFRVPLGTYTGWNPIGSGILKGRERSLAGGYIPFARTRAERLASEDPRLSIEERYPSLQAYVAAATREAAALVAGRLLLPDDAVRLLKQVIDDMQNSQLLPPALTLHAKRAPMTTALLQVATGDRQRTAIIDPSGSYTYGRLDADAWRVANALVGQRHSLAGARVAYLITPGYQYAVVQEGIWRARGIAVPLALSHPLPELEYVLRDTAADIVVCDAPSRARLGYLPAEVGVRLLMVDDLLAGATVARDSGVCPADPALIVYTSGTTGKPKGVVSTHANLAAQIDSLLAAWEWSAADRLLLVLPLHHIHGILNGLRSALAAKATCEIHPNFDVHHTWSRLASGELTVFTAVPTVYQRLITGWEAMSAEDRSRLSTGAAAARVMMSGSAALPVPVLQRWREISGHTLLERYGMTEIGMALSNPLRGDRRPGAVGAPLPGVEVRLVSEDGKPVGDGSPGELEVRGPSVFKEYWQRPAETAAAFRAGYFRTGDMAVLEDGMYRLLGRTSVDIIKTGGFKVSAVEIENALREHAAIAACAVVGLPSDEWGETIAAAVELRPGASLALPDLQEWARARLAPYKIPRDLLIVTALPQNVMGKTIKSEVRQLFQAR